MNTIQNIAELAGRILLSIIFLLSGIGKITGYAETQAYMASQGVPGELLPVVIAVELLGAIAIMVGWKTRVAAFFLAGFTLVSALIFHSNLQDQMQMIMFLKNAAIAGGFLLLVAYGPGMLSVDRKLA
jgi:putative oxidoreductase